MYIKGDENANYQYMYPDVYYKVLPFVIMACEEMDACNCGMPTRDMVRGITTQIYDDVCRVHPDLADRENYQGMSYEAAAAYGVPGYAEAQQWRRGGFFNDLLDILLLNEFFRRRRFY